MHANVPADTPQLKNLLHAAGCTESNGWWVNAAYFRLYLLKLNIILH